MLSEPVYLSVGDEYDKKVTTQHAKGTFVVPAKKHPHVMDSVFQKPFITNSVGDEYKTVGFEGVFRSGNGESEKKRSQVVPFKPTGPSHKSTGKGDYYGTFCESSIPPHEPELPYLGTKNGTTSSKASHLKSFTTNPGKKGTYGYSGLSIGKAGEVQYISDPYDGDRRQKALQHRSNHKQMGVPFSAAAKRGGCFDENNYGVSTVYSITKPLAPKKTASSKPPVVTKPWVPGGALVKEITKFPEYQEDPADLKEMKMRENLMKERQYKAWQPARNDPYRHIYHKPIPYNPPPVA